MDSEQLPGMPAKPGPIALTDAQAFEVERFSRAIDATSDLEALRGMCKQLLQAWMTQKSVTCWVMRQNLSGPALNHRISEDF